MNKKVIGKDPWNYPIYQVTCGNCGEVYTSTHWDLDKNNHKCKKESVKPTKTPTEKEFKILGKTFGNLKVNSRSGKSYLSECLVCGNERRVSYNALTKGNVRNLHCGCLGSKKLRYPPTPETLPNVVWERIQNNLDLLQGLNTSDHYDLAYPQLIRAAWISHCKDLNGEKYHLRNFLFSYIKYSCYNNQMLITNNRSSDMTENVSACDVSVQSEQSGVFDRKPKKLKFQRR